MKLLIVTQKIDENDDVLGFFHGWVEEFAKYCEKVTVICLQKGEYQLPENVKVLSLGKEEGVSRIKYLFNFYKYIWQERKNYDTVFVHMNQKYVILGGLFWRLWGNKISLWYAHGFVPFSLRITEKITDIIFTSTKSGFRLKSNKVNVVGQGIDVQKFQISPKTQTPSGKFKILIVGRISPVKDYETLIEAVEILNNKNVSVEVCIVGGVGLPEQEKYLEQLKQLVSSKGLVSVVSFVGAIPNKKILSYLQQADLFVNTSHTGSLDKAILEAMSCGVPVLTCNEALLEVLGNYKEQLMFSKGDFRELSQKIEQMTSMHHEKREKIGKDLREIVIGDHNLEKFIKKIVEGL